MKLLHLALALLVLLPVAAIAQEEVGSIATDRPVQSETPTVVPKKHLQFEEGVLFEQGIESFKIRTDQLNYNLLIKYGIVKNLELRYNVDYINQETKVIDSDPEMSQVLGGLAGPNIGLKYSFLKDDGESWKPNLTISVHSQFDWYGREEYVPENGNANFRLTAGKNITDSWYVIGGLGTNFEDGNKEATGQYYVAQTGYSFGDLTALIELYGIRNYDIDVNQNALNGALGYLINDNNQIDLSGGMGLNDTWYDYYIAVGYSMRLGF